MTNKISKSVTEKKGEKYYIPELNEISSLTYFEYYNTEKEKYIAVELGDLTEILILNMEERLRVPYLTYENLLAFDFRQVSKNAFARADLRVELNTEKQTLAIRIHLGKGDLKLVYDGKNRNTDFFQLLLKSI